MTDDRSERLRQRRKRSTDRSAGDDAASAATDAGRTDSAEGAASRDRTSGGSESAAPTTGTSTSGGDGEDDGEADARATADPGSVKETQVGTYMYLPESQTKELRRRYNELKAEYEYTFDEEFEKNRHFYPLVVQVGLDGLDELDVSEIRTHLEPAYE